MKFLVLTASSKEYEPLAKITDPSKESYAKKHGYKFKTLTHKNTNRIGFERVEFWQEVLPLCDWLFFTGCDAMITNQEIKLESLIDDDSDFIFAVDGCGLQSDSWIMRNCESTRKMLNWVLNAEKYFQNEQDAIQCYLSANRFLDGLLDHLPEPRQSDGSPASQRMLEFYTVIFNKMGVRCKILPQRSINAYPMQYYGGTGQEEHSWQPGDFVAHLPGKSLEFRIKAFEEINARSNL